MTTAAATCAPALTPTPTNDGEKRRRLPFLPVAALLDAQHTLTAVERFSKAQESPGSLPHSKVYRDLIPLDRPASGQQYAFEVDLDSCTGCKACVAGCHAQNGLDDDELWRTVGLLHGGSASAPVQATVTTSCHHCVEPACMLGCPTQAYEKDPVTGIVKHLDDQCFGCQYCTLMCPYDAPKYSKARGIVRKCDMCSDRLEHGEAPACVEACPNAAIAIRVVERATIVESSDAGQFLPGAPTPEHTLPSTRYKTEKAMPSNMLPADFYTTRPEHSHPPLVVMLTLTQLSVGTFGLGLLVERLSLSKADDPLAQTVFACLLALLALGASVFHLGRPHLAWRAVLGLKSSWLSREALAFGMFAGLAALYAALAAAPLYRVLPGKSWLVTVAPTVHVTAALFGLLGVFCSVMVYVATRREQWSATQTGVKFFGTTLLLGAASAFAIHALTRAHANETALASGLMWIVLLTTVVKLLFEARVLIHARDLRQSAHKRVAIVMLGDLRDVVVARFVLGTLGGFAVPFLVLTRAVPGTGFRTLAVVGLVALLGGEILERYLFFRSAPRSRMPGGLK